MSAITVHGLLADNVLHAVKPCRLPGQPLGRLQGAMGFISRLFMQMPTLIDFFAIMDA